MIKKIKRYFAKKKFNQLCPHIPCTYCVKFYEKDKRHEGCRLADELGL